MAKRYTIAEARQSLAAIVHELEKRSPIEITRRGEPVAILLSLQEYQRLAIPRTGFWQAYEAFRKSVNPVDLDIPADIFGDVRDRSQGRDIRL